MKRLVGRILYTALGLAAAGVASAQEYPSRPVRLVVPYAPGGSTDVTARALSDRMSGLLGQPVVIENRPGAAGQVGFEQVVRGTADGYTLVYSPSSIALLPFTSKSFSVNLEKDVAMLAACCTSPVFLAIPAATPARNVQELVAHFKTNPGKINFGASGVIDALGAIAFANAGGFKVEVVRYKGGAPASQAAITGEVQFVMLPYGNVKPMADAGKLRILAATSPARYPRTPEVPTIAETLQPGFDIGFWNGFYGPSAVPAGVVTRINTAVNAALKLEDVRKRIGDFDMEPMALAADQVRAKVLGDFQRYGKLAKEAGVQPE